jgi:hypothetical protein
VFVCLSIVKGNELVVMWFMNKPPQFPHNQPWTTTILRSCEHFVSITIVHSQYGQKNTKTHASSWY